MKLNIGTSNRVLWDFELPEAIGIIGGKGYGAIELWAEYPHLVPRNFGKERRASLKQKMDEHGLKCFIHATFWDINIASSNPLIRGESIKQIIDCVQLASDMGSEIVVFHPGRLTSTKGAAEEGWKLLIDGIEKCVKAAEELDVILAIENMEKRPQELVISPADIDRLLRDVDSPNLRFTLDVAHANTAGDPLFFIEKLGRSLIHIHLSDNHGLGGGAVHLPLGEGSIDFVEIFRSLEGANYKGGVIIEGYVPSRCAQVSTVTNNKEFIDRVIRSFSPV